MGLRAVTFDLWNTILYEAKYIDLRVNYLNRALKGLGLKR